MSARHSGPKLPPFVIGLFVVDVLIGLAFAAQLAGLFGETGLLSRQLHPGREANLPTWYSSMQWALAAGLFAIYAFVPPPGLKRGLRLWLPAAGTLMLSLDEVATFHEWIGVRTDALLPGGTREGTWVSGTGLWMIVLVPIAAAAAVWVGVLLVDHLRRTPSATRLLVAGALIFVGGAAVVELLSNAGAGNRPLQIGIQIVEETVEMMGVTTVVWGAFELVRSNGIRIVRTIP